MRRYCLLLALLSIGLIGCGSGVDAGGRSAEADQAPSLGDVTPASGSGRTQTFTAKYSHPAGAQHVISAFFLVEKTPTGENSCFLEYNSANSTVNLMNDSGKWQTAVAAGSAGALANTQYSVEAAGVRGVFEGTTLTVTLPLTFSGSYTGTKQLYLSASGPKVATQWIEKGTWIAP